MPRSASALCWFVACLCIGPSLCNPRLDALVDQIRVEMNRERRQALCGEVQKILADDLPYLPLWFVNATSVHRRSLGDLPLSPSGDFDFLAHLRP